MTEQYQDILIKKYLQQTLNKAEKIEFEHLLNTDEDFVQNIYLAKKIRNAEHAALDQSIADYKSKRKASFIRLFGLIITALSVIIGIIYFQNIKNKNNQELEPLKKQKEQAVIDSIELDNKLKRDSNKKIDPSEFSPKEPKKSDINEIKSSKDSIKKPIDIVASNVEEAQFINTNILEIAKRGYSQTASSSNSIPQKKKWLSLFDDLEKTKFKDVTVAQIKGVLKEAEIDFKTVNEETVSENAVFKFVLLNMLVKPPTKTQKQSLDKWLIKFTPNQFTDEQEKYWQEMKNAYKN